MKKKAVLLIMIFAALQTSILASAESVVPTGERVNILPYIFGIVALILIAAFAWLTYLSKKNK